MELHLYNTLTRTQEVFRPIEPGRVKMYTCGPTVYRFIHIGNLRSFLMADWVRRTLVHFGYTVKHVKNITDVGHMRQELRRAKKANRRWKSQRLIHRPSWKTKPGSISCRRTCFHAPPNISPK